MRELRGTNDGVGIEVIEWRPPAAEGASGTPIVCVHGALGSAWTWELDGQAAAAGRIGGRPRALAALSRRGMGRSDAPATGYALDDFIGDVGAAIEATGYRRSVLVGHSLGVPMVIAYAARHPDRVAGLVLGDYGPLYPALDVAWIERIEGRFRRFSGWEAAYQNTMGKTGDEVRDRARFDEIKHRFLREGSNGEILSIFSMDGIRRMQADSRAVELDDRLPTIRCPVLVVTGDGDVLLTPDLRARYERGLSDVRFAILAGADHSLTVAGSSEPFHAELGRFLAGIERRP